MTTDQRTNLMTKNIHHQCHPACIACSEHNRDGLGLRFEQTDDESVVGLFACEPKYQGYPDRLHGGIVTMLVDAAMVHCLFIRRIPAVTARLNIRFHLPVSVGVPATVRAWVEKNTPPLYRLKAEVRQNDSLRASAEALFYHEESLQQQFDDYE